MTFDVSTQVETWRSAPHISARSALVTILGDALLPVSRSAWLAQLLELAGPFGFNSRLVRTSLFRLADEGWVYSERHGRRSRYKLTPFAEQEFADAASRIYSNYRPELSGPWTLVLFDGAKTPARERERLARHLGWHGFVALERGVLASPVPAAGAARRVLAEAFPEVLPAIVEAEFADIDQLVRRGFFSSAFALEENDKAYRSYVETYAGLRGQVEDLSPTAAYCARTMLVHDLRWITLRMPPRPRELLPEPWSGDEAYGLAALLYPQLCKASAPMLGDILGLDYPVSLPHRFSDLTDRPVADPLPGSGEAAEHRG